MKIQNIRWTSEGVAIDFKVKCNLPFRMVFSFCFFSCGWFYICIYLYRCFLLYFRWLLYFYLLCLFIHLCLYLKGQHSESLTLNGGLGATFKTWLRCFTPLCKTLLHCARLHSTVHQALQGHPHLHCLQSYHRSYLAHIGTSSTLPPSCHWFSFRTI